MEDDEEEATRPDHSVDLVEGGTEFSGREIDDGVERNGRPELAPGCGKRQEIAFTELHGRVFPTGDLEHPGRKIDTDGGMAVVREPSRDVPGSTTQIDDGRTVFGLLDERPQQFKVKWWFV